ncbi:MAG TPA: hypothetical protein VM368_01830 [Flavisolibacter sp.]|nr:hypothetical protein [Flavisolibacter sp.]
MRAKFTFLLLITIALFSCTEELEEFESDQVQDYVQPQVGRSITYRTDSTIFTEFGTKTEVRSYQEKHVVDAQIPDASNRPSYRVLRYTRNLAGTEAWKPSGSYLITVANNTFEVVENNLRFLKLVLPIKKDMTWKGNRYLPSDPYGSIYNFSNDDNIADWEFVYTSLSETVTLNGKTYNNVLTVQSIDESQNFPVTAPQQYGFKNFLQEKYAKGVGLVYQDYIMWEYQPNPSGANPFKTGFGVKRTILDRN